MKNLQDGIPKYCITTTIFVSPILTDNNTLVIKNNRLIITMLRELMLGLLF